MKTEISNHSSRFPVFKGVIIALVIQLVLVLILTALFHFTGLSDHYLRIFALVVIVIGVFGGGISAAIMAGNKYVLNGLGVGITSLLIAVIMSLVIGHEFNLAGLGTKLLYYVGAGTAGGMVGALISK